MLDVILGGIIGAIINRIRGASWLSYRYGEDAELLATWYDRAIEFIRGKYMIALYLGIASLLIVPHWWQAIATALCFALIFGLGVGAGFMAIHGKKTWNGNPHKRVIFFSWLTDTLIGTHRPEPDYTYGIVFMSLRWGILSIPLATLYAVYVNLWWLVLIPAFALAGLIYFVAGRISQKYSIEIAELMLGGLIGAIITVLL